MKKLGLDSKVGIYSRDDNFSSNYGILNLHPSRRTHWVCSIKDCYFNLYGCIAPKQLPKYFKKSMEIVFSLNIRFKRTIVIVQVIVFIYFT